MDISYEEYKQSTEEARNAELELMRGTMYMINLKRSMVGWADAFDIEAALKEKRAVLEAECYSRWKYNVSKR